MANQDESKVIVVALTQRQIDALCNARDRLISLWHALGKQDDELSEITEALGDLTYELRFQTSPFLKVSSLSDETSADD